MTVTTTEETNPATDPSPAGDRGAPPVPAATGPLVTADLLVEDVSIDGMCGVY